MAALWTGSTRGSLSFPCCPCSRSSVCFDRLDAFLPPEASMTTAIEGTDLQHRYAYVNGIRMHYVEAGAGELVVFLPGFPAVWYSWRHQIAALAPHYRVVAPDLRGYNESDKPRAVSAYALPELVADVQGLIE